MLESLVISLPLVHPSLFPPPPPRPRPPSTSPRANRLFAGIHSKLPEKDTFTRKYLFLKSPPLLSAQGKACVLDYITTGLELWFSLRIYSIKLDRTWPATAGQSELYEAQQNSQHTVELKGM
jgi:hypothetical protein